MSAAREPILSEDYHRRYWEVGVRRGQPAGPRSTYTARCSDHECLDMVWIEWGAEGWRWHHGDATSEPFVVWQLAADAAVVEAGARPRL